MSWFAAHVVLYVKLKAKEQKRFPVWENIILIKADSEKDAWVKAEEHGRAAEGDDDGTFRWGGQPASWVFAGVRKLTLCEDADHRPGDGTEVTYIEMELTSTEAIQQLVQSEPVAAHFQEKFSDTSQKA